MGNWRKVKSLKNKRSIVVVFFLYQKEKENVEGMKKRERDAGDVGSHFLERECFILSRFLLDPTIGSLRDKKENCSTRRGLRVGTRFKEFRQTP